MRNTNLWLEKGKSAYLELCEDITRRGSVLTTHMPRAELANRRQQREIVAKHEILRHVDNGRVERLLAVVVAGMFSDVTGQLGDLDLLGQVALEARVQDLALKGHWKKKRY